MMDTEKPMAHILADKLEQYPTMCGCISKVAGPATAELRRLRAENTALQAGYDAARLEIASLQARVQELGQAAREINSRRVVELESQLAAIGAGGVEPLRPVSDDEKARHMKWLEEISSSGAPRGCLHQIREPAPVVWPRNAKEVREFMDCNVECAEYANDDESPSDDDRYQLTTHDFLSAVDWWADFPHHQDTPQPSGQAAPVDAEMQRLDYLQECGATVEVLPGRPGWTFRVGGLHGAVHRSVRAAIDAARAAQEGK